MAKFMLKASYTVEGTKGLMKEGGSSRRAAVQKTLEGLGGRLESFYYTMGDADAFAIVDVPDVVTAAALSLAINATGAAQVSTTVLLTPEQIDEAAKKSVSYRAPGA
ncbi:MAG: GYD domain-containing protein [Betaproteobacteria bacterium]|nr:GYD domain-containing protein [Betaproteobacteria bacterium]